MSSLSRATSGCELSLTKILGHPLIEPGRGALSYASVSNTSNWYAKKGKERFTLRYADLFLLFRTSNWPRLREFFQLKIKSRVHYYA